MTRSPRQELEEMRQEGLSADVRRRFEAAGRGVAAWERGGPRPGLAEVLDWVNSLRLVFGDPEVDRTPWRGNDFRL